MKHVFIVNVNANGGRVANKVRDIKEICESLDVDYEFFVSDSREMTMDIAKRFKDEFCVVYAVGGDGTLNAVLNSLVGGNAYLGIVPMGSGNDFYKSLDEHEHIVLNCNVMKVNDLYCINIFSTGIDALVCEVANKLKKLKVPSNLVYNLGIAYAYFKHKNEQMFVDVDDMFLSSVDMSMIVVANGKFYGNGYEIAPRADITESGADVYMVAGLNKKNMPYFFKKVIDREHEGLCIKARGEDIKIISSEPVVAHVDGEVMKSETFLVDANAAQIKVVKNDRVINLVRKLNK